MNKSVEEWRKSIDIPIDPWYELTDKKDDDGKTILILKPVDIKDEEAIEGKHFKFRLELTDHGQKKDHTVSGRIVHRRTY